MKAATYCRVSTEEQAENGTSLDVQSERTRAYIDAQGWVLVGEFVDEGVSGAKASRPALDRLLEACRCGEVEAIVVTKLDRFTRSSRHLENALGDLDDLGVSFVSLSESIDSRTPSGRMFRSMLGAFASFEREQIAERCSAGRLARAREQLWTGGPAPFGFKVEDKRLVVDEEEAKTIRLAASLILDEGVAPRDAAEILNGLGRLPRMGSPWRPFHLRRILRSETAAGRFTWGKVGKSERIEWEIDAILDQERFEALQRALVAVGGAPQGKAQVYPLSGRLTGRCGEPYQGAFDNRTGTRYYRCRARTFEKERRCEDKGIRAEVVEEAVWNEVRALLADPSRLLAMAEEYLELRTAQVEVEDDESRTVDSEIRSIERALTQHAVEALKAGLPAEVIKQATAELTSQLDALRRRQAMIEEWREDSQRQSQRMRRLWELAERAHSHLANATSIVQREVLDLLDVRVSILDEHTRSTPMRIRVEGVVANLDHIVPNVVS